MNITILTIILVVLFILLLPIKSRLKIAFNLYENRGFFRFKLFDRIQIINTKITLRKNYFLLVHKNGKEELVPIDVKDRKVLFYKDFNNNLFNDFSFKSALFYANFGLKDEPFLTAIGAGLIDVASSSFFAKLKAQKKEVNIKNKVFTHYKDNMLRITLKAEVSISILGLIKSYLKSYLKFGLFKNKEAK